MMIKDKLNSKMQNVKFAQTVITQMIIWLSFVQHAISVCIKDVSDWPKFPLRVGFAMYALHSGQQESTYLVRCVMLKVEQWRGQTSILIQIYGNKPILDTMSIQRNVLTTSKSKNTHIPKKFPLKILITKANNRNKSFTTIILTKQPIHRTNRPVTMFGFIMSARFGCLNVTLRKRMAPSMSKESKTSRKNDINMNALYVKNPEQELASSVKIQTVKSSITLNAQGKRKFTWNN